MKIVMSYSSCPISNSMSIQIYRLSLGPLSLNCFYRSAQNCQETVKEPYQKQTTIEEMRTSKHIREHGK